MISLVLNFVTFSEKFLIFSVKSDVFSAPQPRHGAAVAQAKVNMAKKRQFRQIATEFSTLENAKLKRLSVTVLFTNKRNLRGFNKMPRHTFLVNISSR